MNNLKFLNPDEDARLLEVLERDGSRDALMLLLLRYCGMRPSELLSVRRKHLDPYYRTMWVPGLKGSDSRELPIREDLFKRAWAHSAGFRDGEAVFGISYQRLVQIWQFYRPCAKPLKSLRHTLAVTNYQRNRNIRLLQKILGHRDIKSTLVYESYSYGQEELRSALIFN